MGTFDGELGEARGATTDFRLSKSDAKTAVIGASLGTLFEWYDFYVYGLIATVVAKRFFAGLDPTSAFILALLGFGAGFIVRPLGAILFGRIGDLIGRKYTFLITIIVMGAATFGTGLLPTYESAGSLAPIALVGLRLLQGLAIGGEYGGAAVYVSEHAPKGKRGFYTSWIQTTGTAGMFLALVVVLLTTYVTGDDFSRWGWRIPFLMSLPLLLVSLKIRASLHESPVFKKMKEQGVSSKAPLRDAFGNWKNVRLILIALFGVCAGQTVIYFTCQFFPLFFLTQTLKVDSKTANTLVMLSLVVGCPLFILFGALSDRVGRKPVLLAGLVLAGLTFFPIYKKLTHFANPALERAQTLSPIIVSANSTECSFQFNPTGTKKFSSSCDIAKQVLAQSGANYEMVDTGSGSHATIQVGDRTIQSFDGSQMASTEFAKSDKTLRTELSDAMRKAGYPTSAATAQINRVGILLLLVVLMAYAAATYGVVGATLVELFPAKVRYTSFSVPYHVATGWLGGLQPTVSFALIAQFGNIYSGLWYPTIVIAGSAVVALLFLKETRFVDVRT